MRVSLAAVLLAVCIASGSDKVPSPQKGRTGPRMPGGIALMQADFDDEDFGAQGGRQTSAFAQHAHGASLQQGTRSIEFLPSLAQSPNKDSIKSTSSVESLGNVHLPSLHDSNKSGSTAEHAPQLKLLTPRDRTQKGDGSWSPFFVDLSPRTDTRRSAEGHSMSDVERFTPPKSGRKSAEGYISPAFGGAGMSTGTEEGFDSIHGRRSKPSPRRDRELHGNVSGPDLVQRAPLFHSNNSAPGIRLPQITSSPKDGYSAQSPDGRVSSPYAKKGLLTDSDTMQIDTSMTRSMSDPGRLESHPSLSIEERKRAFQSRTMNSYDDLLHTDATHYGSQRDLVDDLVRLGIVPPQRGSPEDRPHPVDLAFKLNAIVEGNEDQYDRVFPGASGDPHTVARNINGLLYHILAAGKLPTRRVRLGQLTRSQTYRPAGGATTPGERFGAPGAMAGLFIPDTIPEDSHTPRKGTRLWNMIEEDLERRPLRFTRDAYLYAVRDALFDVRTVRLDGSVHVDACVLSRVVYLGRVLQTRMAGDGERNAELSALVSDVNALIEGSENVTSIASLLTAKLSCSDTEAMRALLVRNEALIQGKSTSSASLGP